MEGGRGPALPSKEQKAKEELSAGSVQAIISAAKNDAYDAKAFRANPPKRNRDLGATRLGMVSTVFELYEAAMREENISTPPCRPAALPPATQPGGVSSPAALPPATWKPLQAIATCLGLTGHDWSRPVLRCSSVCMRAVDFDDMLVLTTTLLRHSDRTRKKYSGHWRHIAVDEFQDTNSVQYQLLALLGRDHQNIFVVRARPRKRSTAEPTHSAAPPSPHTLLHRLAHALASTAEPTHSPPPPSPHTLLHLLL